MVAVRNGGSAPSPPLARWPDRRVRVVAARAVAAVVTVTVASVLVCFGGRLGGAGVARAAADLFVDEKPGVTVDWRRGMVEVTGGAAGDHRMPSADVARPGSERRATAAARARLAEALLALPLGGGRHLDQASVARALARARVTGVDYQSNGGALVRLAIRFGDWVEGPRSMSDATTPALGDAAATVAARSAGPPPGEATAVLVAECRLGAAPVIVHRGQEISVAAARYVPAATMSAGDRPLRAHADKKGRLVLGEREDPPELAGGSLLVYVGRVSR